MRDLNFRAPLAEGRVTASIILRAAAATLMLLPMISFVSDSVFLWLRSSYGFFYSLVVGAYLLGLASFVAKGTDARGTTGVVAVAVVLLVASWLFDLPMVFSVIVIAASAPVIFIASRKRNGA